MKWEGSKFTVNSQLRQAPLAGSCQREVVSSRCFPRGNSPVAFFSVSETWNPGLFSLDLFGKRIVLPTAKSTSNLIQQGALS